VGLFHSVFKKNYHPSPMGCNHQTVVLIGKKRYRIGASYLIVLPRSRLFHSNSVAGLAREEILIFFLLPSSSHIDGI
jgi:hypothetical protein